MSSDLRALLAAVVANPADNVARLVYADCLEEHGNAARAQFIRLQIEAERHHPDSNTRAELEAQTRVLFEKHWRDWWAEVRTAVSGDPDCQYEPAPRGTELWRVIAPRAPSAWDRIAELFRRGQRNDEVEAQLPPGHGGVEFRRGFPEAVSVFAFSSTDRSLCAESARWPAVSPLTDLTAKGFNFDCRKEWPEGPHLNGVRRLTLGHYYPLSRPAAFDSPNLSSLEDLTLRPDAGIGDARYIDVPAMILAAPWGSRLRALDVQLRFEESGQFLLNADLLSQLEALRVDLPWIDDEEDDFDQERWLRELARSARLAGLRQLTVAAKGQANDMAPLVQRPTWAGLRYLDLDFLSGEIDALLLADDLPELDELRLATVRLSAQTVGSLVRAPLLKRLRHFALRGGYEDGRALLPLVDAVDPARIETFALQIPYFPERAANALRAKFGDRVRFLPA